MEILVTRARLTSPRFRGDWRWMYRYQFNESIIHSGRELPANSPLDYGRELTDLRSMLKRKYPEATIRLDWA